MIVPRLKVMTVLGTRPEIIRLSRVIPALDLDTIYRVPMAYHEAGLDTQLLKVFGIEDAPPPDLARWKAVLDRVKNPEGQVRIAVVGKYMQVKDSYKSLSEVARAITGTRWSGPKFFGLSTENSGSELGRGVEPKHDPARQRNPAGSPAAPHVPAADRASAACTRWCCRYERRAPVTPRQLPARLQSRPNNPPGNPSASG